MIEYYNRKQKWETIICEDGVVVMSINISWEQNKYNVPRFTLNMETSEKSSDSSFFSTIKMISAIQNMKQRQISTFNLLKKTFSNKRRLKFAKENFINESGKLYDAAIFTLLLSVDATFEISSITAIIQSFNKMLDTMIDDIKVARTKTEIADCSADLLEWLIDAPINFMLKLEQFHRKKIDKDVTYKPHKLLYTTKIQKGAENKDCSFYLYAA